MYRMIKKSSIAFCILLLWTTQTLAAEEITGILQHATGLTPEEINALRPLFKLLQNQYDYISTQTQSPNPDEDAQLNTDPNEDTNNEFENYFEKLLQEHTVINSNNNNMTKYNTTLPTVTELIGAASLNQSTEALAERADIESLLDEALNEAQTQIDEIVGRSLELEMQLLRLNKPKLVKYIFRALRILYRSAARVGRAAYCTYSYMPQLNESLHNIYDGIDCYNYTKHLVLQVEQETVQTVSTIRQNVFNLAVVYKKISAKKTLLGKLSAVFLNLVTIVRNINSASQAGIIALDKLQRKLPDAVDKSVSCGRKFVDGVPQMTEVAANLNICITYVDQEVNDYHFMKPVNERDFV